MSSFWDTYDDRPIDIKPGYEHLAPRPTLNEAVADEAWIDAAAKKAIREARARSSQNATSGVCDWCGIASDDVLLGVCADCV